jgi:hypothetical protein
MICRAVLPILVLLAPAAFGADPTPLAEAVPLPERDGTSLDGVALGDSFDSVNALLGLRNITPIPEREDTWMYRWPTSIQRSEVRPNVGDEKFRRLEIVFRDERVVEVRTIYSSRMRYTRMGPDLIARYGDPTMVRSGPPRELPVPPVGSPEDGKQEPIHLRPGGDTRLRYLWVEVWRWQWEESEFTLIGEHYTSDKNRVDTGQHIFRLKLAAR